MTTAQNLQTAPQLSTAPGLDKDHWPSMADKTWASKVHRFYDTPCSAD